MVTTKVERLAVELSVESSCLVDGHSAVGVFDFGFRVGPGYVHLLMVVETIF